MSTGNVPPDNHDDQNPAGRVRALIGAWRGTVISWGVAVGIGLLFYVGWVWIDRPPRPAPEINPALPELAKDVKEVDDLARQIQVNRFAAQAELDLLRKLASERKSTSATSLARLARLQASGADARERLKQLTQEMATWKTKVAPLLSNEEGKRIAASASHLEFCLVVLARPRPSEGDLSLWREQLHFLLDPIDGAIRNKDGDFTVLDEHQKDLATIGKTLRQALDEIEHDRLLMERLIVDSAHLPPSKETLDQVLTQRRIDEAKAQVTKVIAARKRAQDEATGVLKKLEEEKVAAEIAIKRREDAAAIAHADEKARVKKLEDDAEIARIEAIALAKKRDIDRQLADMEAKHKEEEAKAKYLQEYEKARPEIDRLLCAFTTDGYKHRQDGKKGPVSFGLLESQGAMEPTRAGMQALMHLSTQNDRPSGAIPKFYGSETDWQRANKDVVARAQTLLKKYGPYMVEKGLLAP